MSTTSDHPPRQAARRTDLPSRDAHPPVRCATHEGALYRPDMLMIGSFARNSGKTELACRIIRRHSDSAPVVGLKITTIDRADGHCPHGDTGCGVCSSQSEPWVVTPEVDRDAPKDTCRLLASGAHEVYWLRVLRSELAGGACDLLTRLPSGRLSVCESNSLRRVVEPGLFLQVRAVDVTRCKPSARTVAHLADHLVVSDGRSFDLDLERISVVDGQWALRREACAVIIDGDHGGDETERNAALRRTRRSLEPQFDRIELGPETCRRSARRWAESVAAGLKYHWCFIAPSLEDGVPPAVVNALFRRRSEVDVVVATTGAGRREVCLTLCRGSLLPEVMAALGRGPGAVAALGERCAVRELRLRPTDSGAGLERLPEPAAARHLPESKAASRGGAESP